MTGSASVRRAHDLVVDWTLRLIDGLPGDVARDRFEQIVSDLWEQEHDGRRRGFRLALSILSRFVRGFPVDLSWRIGVLADVRANRVPGDEAVAPPKKWVPLAAPEKPFDQTNGTVDFDVPPERGDNRAILGLLEAGAAGSVLAQGFGGLGG